MNASYAMNVVSETHDAWKELVISKNGNVVSCRVASSRGKRSRAPYRNSPPTSRSRLATTPHSVQVRSSSTTSLSRTTSKTGSTIWTSRGIRAWCVSTPPSPPSPSACFRKNPFHRSHPCSTRAILVMRIVILTAASFHQPQTAHTCR